MRRALLVALLGGAAIGGSAVGLNLAQEPTRTADGTQVGGLPVGSSTEEQLATLLSTQLASRPTTLAVTMGTRRATVSYADLGVRVDVAATARRAVLDSGDKKVLGILGSGDGSSVDPVVVVDDAALSTATRKLVAAGAITATRGDLAYTAGHVVAVTPRAGQVVDAAKAKDALLAAARDLTPPTTLALAVRTTAPLVKPADVQALASTADRDLKDVALTASALPAITETATATRASLGRGLGFADAPGGGLELVLDDADALLDDLAADLRRAPVEPRFATPAVADGVLEAKGNATFSPRPAKVTVTAPGRVGQQVDRAALEDALVTAVRQGLATQTVPATVAQPGTTPAQAQLVNAMIGTFTTRMPCCVPRVKNIQTMARTVDGTVIAPGEQFSLNGIVGRRTRAKGYVEAPFILDGKLDLDIGGGVSQFATTTYNAAFFAGLRLDSHKAHSFYISRYPAGREATVNYPGIDLTWTNDTGAPVIVRTKTTGSSVTVALFGNNGGRTTSSTTGPRKPVKGHDFRITITRTITGPKARTEKITTLYNEHPPED